jgi:hypothetical protein
LPRRDDQRNSAFIATSGDASMRNTDPLRNAYPDDFFRVPPRKGHAGSVVAICALVAVLALVAYTAVWFVTASLTVSRGMG